jgi:hypothetical protein
MRFIVAGIGLCAIAFSVAIVATMWQPYGIALLPITVATGMFGGMCLHRGIHQ